MMASQPARRAVAALRAIHDEQVLMWEPFWQSSPRRRGPALAGRQRPATPRTPA